jgi:hypothetical protein
MTVKSIFSNIEAEEAKKNNVTTKSIIIVNNDDELISKNDNLMAEQSNKKIFTYNKLTWLNFQKKSQLDSSVKNKNDDEDEFENKIEEEYVENLNKYGSNTNSNLRVLKEADCRHYKETLYKKFDEFVLRRFNHKNKIEFHSEYTNSQKRILDLEKDFKCKTFVGHILILGYQENLSNLLRYLTFNFPKRKICIISNESDSIKTIKLLKQYKHLYFLKGSPISPSNLINAGIYTAGFCFFLVENIEKSSSEDLQNLLSYRSQDFFFSCKSIIEMWNTQSIRHLGYIPFPDKSGILSDNEFLNPLFMAGKVFYISHLDMIFF